MFTSYDERTYCSPVMTGGPIGSIQYKKYAESTIYSLMYLLVGSNLWGSHLADPPVLLITLSVGGVSESDTSKVMATRQVRQKHSSHVTVIRKVEVNSPTTTIAASTVPAI